MPARIARVNSHHAFIRLLFAIGSLALLARANNRVIDSNMRIDCSFLVFLKVGSFVAARAERRAEAGAGERKGAWFYPEGNGGACEGQTGRDRGESKRGRPDREPGNFQPVPLHLGRAWVPD